MESRRDWAADFLGFFMPHNGDHPHSPPRRETAVIAQIDVLAELASVGEFLCLADLGVSTADANAHFRGVSPEALRCDNSERARLMFVSVVTPLLSSAAVVVWHIAEPDDVARLREWLAAFTHAASVHVQPDRLQGVDWTLVIVSTCALGEVEYQVIRECMAAATFNAHLDSNFLRRCYLMTDQLRVGSDDSTAASRDAWACAVGRLLIHLRSKELSEEKPSGFIGWTTNTLSLVTVGSRFSAVVSNDLKAVLKLEAHPSGGSSDTDSPSYKQDPIEPAPVPGTRSEACEMADQRPPAEALIKPEFVTGEVRAGLFAVRGRVIGWAESWRSGISKSEADLSQKLSKHRRTSGLGSAVGRAKVLHDAWERVRRARINIRTLAGGQWLDAPKYHASQLLRDQDNRWRDILEHDLLLRRAINQTTQCANELVRAREAYVGLGWRLLVSACVSLFMGILAATAVAGITGSTVAGASVAGFLAAIGSLAVALPLHLLEGARGTAAAAKLETELGNREADISNALTRRAKLVREGAIVAGDVHWYSLCGAVRALASRLLAIEGQALSFCIADEGERVVDKQAWNSFRRATTRALPPEVTASIGGSPDERHASMLEKVASQARKTWKEFAESEDVALVGRFRIAESSRAISQIIRTASAEIERHYANVLVSRSLKDHEFEPLLVALVPDKSKLPFLSVRTQLYSGKQSSGPPVLWIAEPLATRIGGPHYRPSPCLDEGGGVLALAVVECSITFGTGSGWQEIPWQGVEASND